MLDMSDGAIVDRFYVTCLETGKNPNIYYSIYGGRAAFCRSVRSVSRGGKIIKPISQEIKND